MTGRSFDLAANDRLFWELAARYPARPMICNFYLELAGPPDRAGLRRLIEGAVAAHPRLGWRLTCERGAPRWRPHGPPVVAWRSDPSLTGHADQRAQIVARLGEALAADDPAWSFDVVSDRPEGAEDARFHGVWLRWHHALADVEGVFDLLGALCEAAPEGPLGGLATLGDASRGDRKPTAFGARDGGRGRLARFLIGRLRTVGRSRTTAGGARVEVRSAALGLSADALSAVASALAVTTSDVLVAVAARAIAQLSAPGGAEPGVMLVPLSARPPDGRIILGNHTRTLRLTHEPRRLAADASTRAIAGARVRAVAAAGAIPNWFFTALFRLPRRVLDRALARAPRYIVNYLPWSSAPLSLAGPTIEAIHGYPPLLPYQGATIAFTRYADRLGCLLTTDPTIVAAAEADALTRAIEASAAEVAALAPRLS